MVCGLLVWLESAAGAPLGWSPCHRSHLDTVRALCAHLFEIARRSTKYLCVDRTLPQSAWQSAPLGPRTYTMPMQYTPTRTPPRRDALQAAVDAADKGSALRKRAAAEAAAKGSLLRRERERDEDSNALGEYTRRGYEPPSDRAAETRVLSFSSSSSSDADDDEPDEAAAEPPSQSWLQLICPWAPWRQ